MNVGIEFNMRSNDIKRFYNIGSEKSWILTAMEDDENKSRMTVCQLLGNCFVNS